MQAAEYAVKVQKQRGLYSIHKGLCIVEWKRFALNLAPIFSLHFEGYLDGGGDGGGELLRMAGNNLKISC